MIVFEEVAIYKLQLPSLGGQTSRREADLFFRKTYLSGFGSYTDGRFSGYFPSLGEGVRGPFVIASSSEKVGSFAQGPRSHWEERNQGPLGAPF